MSTILAVPHAFDELERASLPIRCIGTTPDRDGFPDYEVRGDTLRIADARVEFEHPIATIDGEARPTSVRFVGLYIHFGAGQLIFQIVTASFEIRLI